MGETKTKGLEGKEGGEPHNGTETTRTQEGNGGGDGNTEHPHPSTSCEPIRAVKSCGYVPWN